MGHSAGVEPDLDRASLPSIPNVDFFGGYFSDAIGGGLRLFDVITLLAVLEHVPPAQQQARWRKPARLTCGQAGN